MCLTRECVRADARLRLRQQEPGISSTKTHTRDARRVCLLAVWRSCCSAAVAAIRARSSSQEQDRRAEQDLPPPTETERTAARDTRAGDGDPDERG